MKSNKKDVDAFYVFFMLLVYKRELGMLCHHFF